MTRRYMAAMVPMLFLVSASTLPAQEYKVRVIASGLARPTGIAVDDDVVYFTEVPQPGVSGGANSVRKLDLEHGRIRTLHSGEPEPINIAVGADGSIYWVCRTAGVILKRDEDGVTAPFLTGLHRPVGIAVNRRGTIYFTQVPTPGMAGGLNGVFSSTGGSAGVHTIHMGEPEPVDIAVAANGDLYWTCRTAGVILVRTARDGMTRTLISGLKKPTGLALDRRGRNLYFTEVPTPGLAGSSGGTNRVAKYDLVKGQQTTIHLGDPEPTDVAVSSDGTVYWTCSSAGVIVEARLSGRHGDDSDR